MPRRLNCLYASRLAQDTVQDLSGKGYWILAVARSESDDPGDLAFPGLLAIADPPRPDSKEMIGEMKRLGVQVKMLTGDNIAIAREIAREVALGDRIVAMADVKTLSDQEQADTIEHSDGIAGIYPEDKYGIVKLMQSKGHIVGMTGDGVNDSPALKQAEVGIAVSNATVVTFAALGVYGYIVPPVTAAQLSFVLLFSAAFTLLMDFPKYWVFRKYAL